MDQIQNKSKTRFPFFSWILGKRSFVPADCHVISEHSPYFYLQSSVQFSKKMTISFGWEAQFEFFKLYLIKNWGLKLLVDEIVSQNRELRIGPHSMVGKFWLLHFTSEEMGLLMLTRPRPHSPTGFVPTCHVSFDSVALSNKLKIQLHWIIYIGKNTTIFSLGIILSSCQMKSWFCQLLTTWFVKTKLNLF